MRSYNNWTSIRNLTKLLYLFQHSITLENLPQYMYLNLNLYVPVMVMTLSCYIKDQNILAVVNNVSIQL